ncbi:hypothetical protein E1284_13235 [Actinomadura bangladeshensis]|uniref:Uncharacterized protein n=1 Tax=Actinomadura bangladeshensis TaxID=453573 RepID=A0A4V6PA42_9ACTN|nr:hypothetical protein E1284_13235 [Actinomadura bangladeshensis]
MLVVEEVDAQPSLRLRHARLVSGIGRRRDEPYPVLLDRHRGASPARRVTAHIVGRLRRLRRPGGRRLRRSRRFRSGVLRVRRAGPRGRRTDRRRPRRGLRTGMDDGPRDRRRRRPLRHRTAHDVAYPEPR